MRDSSQPRLQQLGAEMGADLGQVPRCVISVGLASKPRLVMGIQASWNVLKGTFLAPVAINCV